MSHLRRAETYPIDLIGIKRIAFIRRSAGESCAQVAIACRFDQYQLMQRAPHDRRRAGPLSRVSGSVLGHAKIESTVRDLSLDVEDALELTGSNRNLNQSLSTHMRPFRAPVRLSNFGRPFRSAVAGTIAANDIGIANIERVVYQVLQGHSLRPLRIARSSQQQQEDVMPQDTQPQEGRPGQVAPQDTPSQKVAKELLKRFPIEHPAIPDTNVGGGSYDVGVKSFKISINKIAPSDDQIGRYDAVIHMHCGEDRTGFKGGCYYKLNDDRGNVVWAMLNNVYGMNGKLIPGAPSEDDKIETNYIPVEVLTAVHSVDIVPVRMEDDAIGNLRALVAQLCEGIQVVRDGLKNAGANVAEIIAALKAL